MTRLEGLVRLEALLLEHARARLEEENPQYVQAFNEALPSGLEYALDAARPHLGSPPSWYELLTRLFEVELALDHVTQTLLLMEGHRDTSPREDGRLLDYHVNYWVIQSSALLEKADSLVSKVYRALVRPERPAFEGDMSEARSPLAGLRAQLSGLRDPLVHGLTEGSSRGLEEERMWEAGVLLNATMDEILTGKFENLPAFRDSWYAVHVQLTAMLIAAVEASLKKTAGDVSSLGDGQHTQS